MTNMDGRFDETATQMTTIATTAGLVERPENLRAAQRGVTVAEVRAEIARHLKTTPDTLANIRKGRRQSVPDWLRSKLLDALIAALSAEIRRCQHEIDIARQCGLDAREPDFQAAETALATAKRLLNLP